MYSIAQLQVLDYLLKSITKSSKTLSNKNLKLVINFSGNLWHGDFVQFNNRDVIHPYIDNTWHFEHHFFSGSEQDAGSLLELVKKSYYAHRENDKVAMSKYANLPILFDLLVKTIGNLDLGAVSSPLPPYLLDAKSLDSKVQLPFINLIGENKIKLVSIIETNF